MARVNLTIPDEVLEAARSTGINVSRVASAALADEVDRRARVAALEAYLAELDAEHPPVTAEQADEARRWADGLRVEPQPPERARRRR